MNSTRDGAPDPQSMLAELRAQVEALRRERDAAVARAEKAEALAEQQRDEARALVREYADDHDEGCECSRCRKAARILEVKP